MAADRERLNGYTKRIDALVAEGKLTSSEWSELTDAINARIDETTAAPAAGE
jgi:hypothetical protein